MLSRARRRRFAAHSAACVAGLALAAAPAATAAELGTGPLPHPLPTALPTLPVGGTAPGGAPVAAVAARAGRCRDAGARPGHAGGARMRSAVLCLVNRVRARHGRRGLAADGRLMRAAARHAADMARRHYFSHVSPSGSGPAQRARAAGWRGGVGEAIAWGCGALSSPRATVRAWMASPPHRAILVGGRHAVGVGYRGTRACGGHADWVLDVG
jgi:uncharacterized protein YkwD